ncbi:MAG TPA: nitroreductase family deazaflavin-dependent oxidoreductase [Frankiaceae bacterium]|nr:nitroreductase family deazaflavin-dependent oxidoreductase [Frankiaceae bacterium]
MSAFPDVRWGSESSRIRKPLIAFAGTPLGSWLIKQMVPVDRWLIRHSNSRLTMLGPSGAPLLLLTTTGAKSGLPRTTPLVYARDGDDLVVVGSNYGAEQHPAWSSNLLAHPEAVVTIGGTAVPARATLLAGAEADAAFEKVAEMIKTYRVYRRRTDRTFRIFRLSAT